MQHICLGVPFDINITLQAIDPREEVRYPWEAFFRYPVGSQYVYGTFGSTLRVDWNDTVLYSDDLVDTNPQAEINQCSRCHHPPPPPPPPPPKKNTDDKPHLPSKTESESDSKASSVSDHRVLSNSSQGSNGKDGNGKPQRPPLQFPFALSDGDGDGWYRGGNNTLEVCEGNPDSRIPAVISYPRYFISNKDGTDLIHSGTICGLFGAEACQEVLPYDGKFVWRVGGYAEDPDTIEWDFCGVHGALGEELQFEMRKGKCFPIISHTSDEYCEGITTLALLAGSLEMTSASSVLLTPQEINALEASLSEFLFQANVHIVSLGSSDDDGEEGFEVYFTAAVVLETIGFVGTYMDDLSDFEDQVSQAVDNGPILLSRLQQIGSSSVTMRDGTLTHLSAVSFTDLEVSSITYRVGVSLSTHQRFDSSQWEDKPEVQHQSETKSNDSVMSIFGIASSAALVLLVGAVVATLVVLKRRLASQQQQQQLQHDPESSSHALVDDIDEYDSARYHVQPKGWTVQ